MNIKIKSNIAIEIKEFLDFLRGLWHWKPMKYLTQFTFELKIKVIIGNVQITRQPAHIRE